MKAIYWCYFTFQDSIAMAKSYSFETFKDGFWLTNTMDVALTIEDAKYWIPPSKVNYVVRAI